MPSSGCTLWAPSAFNRAMSSFTSTSGADAPARGDDFCGDLCDDLCRGAALGLDGTVSGGRFACDPSSCSGKLADGRLVAYALAQAALEEDCRRAALVVATRGDPPQDCKAVVIERALWRQRGALAVRRQGGDFVIQSARTGTFDRPWAPARGQP